MNNSNLTKQTIPNSTPSNLLGKVDLDDEDDLLTKYQTKKLPIELHDDDDDRDFSSKMTKFNSNIQSMIDSKWNAYKTSSKHDDDNGDEDHLYSRNRQRTSSHTNGVQPKILLAQPENVKKFEVAF